MVPFWVITIGLFMRNVIRANRRVDWEQGTRAARRVPQRPSEPPRKTLESLRLTDPAFSLVVFEDFLSALFVKAHEARGDGVLSPLAGYLAPSAQQTLAALSPEARDVTTVIVGALRYVTAAGVSPPEERVRVVVTFEANYTETTNAGDKTYYAEERWMLSRARSARSRPPEAVRTFGCPSCAAPLVGGATNVCAHCARPVDTGEFDWLVEEIQPLQREERGPQLTGDTEEQGTDLETIVDPEATTRRAELLARDPSLTWAAFEARVRLIFDELQKGWSHRDPLHIRPFLTDNLFQTQLYWIRAYEKAGLRNDTEGSRLEGLRLARVVSDAYYDAITVRVRAEGHDVTVKDDTGEVVSGSPDRIRKYTEYWTLIRGLATRGAARTEPLCPGCGAALKVTHTGDCEYCEVKVSSGNFDWVLSRIEQDDSYRG
jgi:hypothetical protein